MVAAHQEVAAEVKVLFTTAFDRSSSRGLGISDLIAEPAE
jgi:hypothetical protein